MGTSSNPLDALDAQNLAALQESLSTMQAAQANGVPNMQSKIQAAQAAITGYGATPTAGSTSGQIAQSVLGAITDPVPGAGIGNAVAQSPAVQALTGKVTDATVLYASRFIILIVGLMLIAAGLFTFRTTQNVIAGTTRVVRKGAKIAAGTA